MESQLIFMLDTLKTLTSNPMTTVAANAKYLGTVVTTSPAPVDYASYAWSLIKGTDGEKGYLEKEQDEHFVFTYKVFQ